VNTSADGDLSFALQTAASAVVADASSARTLGEFLRHAASLDALIAGAVAAGLPPLAALEQAFGAECMAAILAASAAAIGELNTIVDDAEPSSSQRLTRHERGVAARMAARVLRSAERAREHAARGRRRSRIVPCRVRPRARRAARRGAHRAAAAVRDGPPPGDAPPAVTRCARVARGRVR